MQRGNRGKATFPDKNAAPNPLPASRERKNFAERIGYRVTRVAVMEEENAPARMNPMIKMPLRKVHRRNQAPNSFNANLSRYNAW
jgi:hypothetical protein